MVLRRILPKILALLTREDRYIPVLGKDFEWLDDSWVHNVFRTYEIIFGRRHGIKHESSACVRRNADGAITETHAFHTAEAALKFVEHKVREMLRFEWVPIRVYISVLSTPSGMPVFASPYLFAIAYNNSAKQDSATSTTATLTNFPCATTNGLIVTSNNSNTAKPLTGISAATDGAFTLIARYPSDAAPRVEQWYLLGTTVSTQTLTATSGTSSGMAFDAASYSGVKQTGQPDATHNNLATTGSTYADSVTTIADNCWVMWSVFNGDITGGAVTAGTNTTVRQNDNGGGSLSDTNAAITPAGSTTLNLSKTGNDKWWSVMASFAPATAAAVVTRNINFLLMGVGQ